MQAEQAYSRISLRLNALSKAQHVHYAHSPLNTKKLTRWRLNKCTMLCKANVGVDRKL